MKTAKRLILSFTVGICIMLIVLLATFAKKSIGWDIQFSKWCNTNAPNALVRFLKVITAFGSIYCLAIVMISLFFVKNKTYMIVGCFMLALTALFGVAVKYIIKRPRPEVTFVKEIGYSFPSAHAMLSLFTFGFLIYVLVKLIKNKALKISLVCLISSLILIVSFSRVVLGVHYLTDILAGWCIAIPFLIGTIIMCEHFLKNPIKFNKKHI